MTDLARELAKAPHKAPATDLPAPFADLPYDQYVGIRLKPEQLAWAGDNVGFAIEPLPRGFIFTTEMAINLVEDGSVKPLTYAASGFNFGAVKPPAPNTPVTLSGFRILQTSGTGAPLEVAIFQGASFMRAVARGQTLGIVSRAL